ncbi:hypothetical protein MIR68_012356 [Amoeboaphelidium protococcarum]|nr:hypothetical protein MIR68_012356 [Amoeboaphelidium protococcarum]KAI3652909.1 hypothetical protein MP228_002334 [Amoeboaphelidium protococcarum]
MALRTQCFKRIIPVTRSIQKRPLVHPQSKVSSSSDYSFYDDHVAEYAARPITRLSLSELLSWSNDDKTTQLVQRELPTRIARIIRNIQALPFIVGMNPYIKRVYLLYLDSLERLRLFEQQQLQQQQQQQEQKLSHGQGMHKQAHQHTHTQSQDFPQVLKEMVDSHSEIIQTLAQGMSECRPYLSEDLVTSFLNKTIQQRIGVRVLAEHYLALNEGNAGDDLHHQNVKAAIDQQQDNFGYGQRASSGRGIVDFHINPRNLLKSSIVPMVSQLSELHYGMEPEVVIDGDIQFPYIKVHLEYILTELLKNSFRASILHTRKKNKIGHVPQIHITLIDGDGVVTIRIRDHGGGIPRNEIENVWRYSYSTVDKQEEIGGGNVLSVASQETLIHSSGGPMAGLGYGLPMARIYAEWAGGSLKLMSMPGHGTDTFLRLPHIKSQDLSI